MTRLLVVGSIVALLPLACVPANARHAYTYSWKGGAARSVRAAQPVEASNDGARATDRDAADALD